MADTVHSSDNVIRTEFVRNGITYVKSEFSLPDDDTWYDLTIRAKRNGDVMTVHQFPHGSHLLFRKSDDPHYVLMGNDFPSGVYDNGETAQLALRKVTDAPNTAPRIIYWKLYPFKLNGDPNG